MDVKIVNRSRRPLPNYSTSLSVRMDIKVHRDAPITLKSMERRLIPTGLFMELPDILDIRGISNLRLHR